MTDKERAAALVVAAIIETIEETKEHGAPLGPLYAALTGMISYETFASVISALEHSGIIKVRHHCAYVIKSWKDL